jgi:hypothetical protein
MPYARHLVGPNLVKLALLATLLFPACLGISDPGDGELNLPIGPGKRVLFIGNSLTYANDLPAYLTAISVAAGDTAYETRMVAYPDYALEDHWNEGTALRVIRATNWDVVVMQQGPSSLPENQIFLRDWAVRFAPEIRAAGAEPALYMVWPALSRSQDFPGVRMSYANAAAAVNGVFLPAGDAWLRAWARDASVPLYGPDNFHPSGYGTFLAALVIYEKLSGKSVVGMPVPVGVSIPAAVLQLLQEAAHEAVTNSG